MKAKLIKSINNQRMPGSSRPWKQLLHNGTVGESSITSEENMEKGVCVLIHGATQRDSRPEKEMAMWPPCPEGRMSGNWGHQDPRP